MVILVAQIWMLPLLVALEVLPDHTSQWVRYALNAMLVGYPYVHPIYVALTSRNAGTVRTRTVGSALYNMCVQASNVISSNIYRTDDQPFYRRGNRVLLGIVTWNIVFILSTKAWYVWRNIKREKVWNAMSEAERKDYLEGLGKAGREGNKRLDFRFAH